MEGEQYFPCVPTPDCPYFSRPQGCHEITAHLYHPASDYTTFVEKIFRNLVEKKETRCRRFEEYSHAVESPPDKPLREDMLEAILATKGFISAAKKKRLGI